MEEKILKGNFKVKNPPQKEQDAKETFQETYRKKVMGSIGGSMVYMERRKFTWDGEQEK